MTAYRPRVLWRYPDTGGLCSQSTNLGETTTWCGTGWTGQPNVLVDRTGDVEVRIGAYDGASGKAMIYMDGVLKDTHTNASLTGNVKSGQVAALGRDGANSRYFFKGGIDDVRLYGRALTAGEIGDLAGQITMQVTSRGEGSGAALWAAAS